MMALLRAILNLPIEASSYARAVDNLHVFVITTTMLGATLVFLLALWYTIRYRRRGVSQLTPRMQVSTAAETLMIGGILSLFLLWWVIGYVQYARMAVPPENASTVYVMGKQWMWKFAYPDGRSAVDVLTVPVGKPVKLVMTSRDVIHSFYVPAFRMKHDVVPGRYYSAWFEPTKPGVYEIFCAEYCGTSHSRMLGSVLVMSQSDYAEWLDGQPKLSRESEVGRTAQGGGDLAQTGRQVAVRRACVACHTIDGQSHVGPTWAGLYNSSVNLTDGRTVVADDAYLTKSMMDPNAEVVAGYRSIMPTYLGVLSEPEVAALVEFIKSLKSVPFTPSVKLPETIAVPDGGTRPEAQGHIQEPPQ